MGSTVNRSPELTTLYGPVVAIVTPEALLETTQTLQFSSNKWGIWWSRGDKWPSCIRVPCYITNYHKHSRLKQHGLLSHSFHGSGVHTQLGWVFWWGAPKAVIKVSARAAVSPRHRALFQAHMVVGKIHVLVAAELNGSLLLQGQQESVTLIRKVPDPLIHTFNWLSLAHPG